MKKMELEIIVVQAIAKSIIKEDAVLVCGIF